jgi:micrococcal nuclease
MKNKRTIFVISLIIILVLWLACSLFIYLITRFSQPLIDNLNTENVQGIDTKISYPMDSQFYEVTKVVDGDTIKVNIDGNIETIRLIGVDTPETVDPRKPVQCFGMEASNKTKEILTGRKVRLEADPSQGERDKYGRLLRYVFLPSGIDFNLQLIQEGYAHEYTYKVPYKYQREFKAAEKNAIENNIGLWGTSCNNS